MTYFIDMTDPSVVGTRDKAVATEAKRQFQQGLTKAEGHKWRRHFKQAVMGFNPGSFFWDPALTQA